MSRHQPTGVSKTIQDFNRECAEEKARRCSNPTRKYEKRIQNYVIDMAGKLGEGTFSKVYRGKEMGKDVQVAVKIVELKKIEELGIEDLFWEEINIIRRLKHPNVVCCFEYFKTTNNCYTIYEYCEGGDLSKRLKKGHLGEKEDISQANSIIKDVFQGLLYLESMSIVHRDIKAANILLAGGKAKIGDFGFATHCKHEFKDVSIGSPAYMAPEGLIHSIYGPKSDVWSFGMLIYEIVHGQTPYHNCESEGELKQRVQIPVNWDQLKSTLPSPLKRLILKCLKIDYKQRPTFSELLNDEYIQKIYQDGCINRHNSKSNYTKVTSDSEGTPLPKNYQRASISPLAIKQQRFVTENSEQEGNRISRQSCNIKTEPSEESTSVLPMLMESLNLSELIELANKNAIDAQIQPIPVSSSNNNLFEGVVLERFLILTLESYSQECLEMHLNIVTIFKQAISLLESSQLETFIRFANQLLLQIYLKAKSLNLGSLSDQITTKNDLISGFSAQLLLNDSQLPYQQMDAELFGLIKQAQTAIDRQDIEGHQSMDQQNKLVFKGSILIIALQLVFTLESHSGSQHWVRCYSSIELHSSEQFFMWLYELELKRMQREQNLS